MAEHPKAIKALGQHFLTDQNIIQKIIGAIQPNSDSYVYEIGPGPGAITEPILATGAHMTLFELDKRFALAWAAHTAAVESRLNVVQIDALKVKWDEIEVPAQIVGNLPYNVGTQILMNLLPHAARFQNLVFMLQQEVIERIVAEPGNKNWGRLGIWAQLFCETELLCRVPPSAFQPAPKVDSAVVVLHPLPQPRYQVNLQKLDTLINRAFGQRRKMLRSSLKGLLNPSVFEAVGIQPTQRPEELSLAEICALADKLN